MKKTVLFGVAGAGKTFKCCEQIQHLLKIDPNIKIDNILFTTFTKSGIHSMKETLRRNNVALPKQNWFNTLHSLCWRLCGYSQVNELKQDHLKEFCDSHRIDYKPITSDEDDNDDKSTGQILIDLYEGYQNIKCKSLANSTREEVVEYIREKSIDDENIKGTLYDLYARYLFDFDKWKNINRLYMYSDCLVRVLESKIVPPCNVMIIDEAQDLFPLQCKIVDMWIQYIPNIEYLIISGDDDQTVHGWSGSDANYLINHAKNSDAMITLEKSYRCPRKVCDVCNEILSKIKVRHNKKIRPYDYPEGIKEGNVLGASLIDLSTLLHRINEHYKKGEKVFVLTRTNRIRREIAKLLFEKTDIPFSYINNDLSQKWSEKMISITNAINKLNAKGSITFSEACNLIKVIPADKLNKGIKTNFRERRDLNEVTYSKFISEIMRPTLASFYGNKKSIKDNLLEIIDYYGIGSTKNKDATKTAERIDNNKLMKSKMQKINSIIEVDNVEDRRHIKLSIRIGTYHSSKGLTCGTRENKGFVYVILNTNKYFQKIDDSELRCLYVASSRTKDGLVYCFIPGLDSGSETLLYDWFRNNIKVV